MRREIYIRMPSSVVAFRQVDRNKNTWSETEYAVGVKDGECVLGETKHDIEVGNSETEGRIKKRLEEGGQIICPLDRRPNPPMQGNPDHD